MEELYFSFFEQYRPLADEEKKALVKTTNFRTFPKGHFFVREGDRGSDCFLILKGCVREYAIRGGEEVTSNFYSAGEFALSLESFEKNIPSPVSLQCIEETSVAMGDSFDEQELYRTCPELETLSRTIMEKAMMRLHSELSRHRLNTPEERYQMLMEEKPDLLQRVPQYLIASYIGVKPESLSRIRKRMAKGNAV